MHVGPTHADRPDLNEDLVGGRVRNGPLLDIHLAHPAQHADLHRRHFPDLRWAHLSGTPLQAASVITHLSHATFAARMNTAFLVGAAVALAGAILALLPHWASARWALLIAGI